MKPLRELSTEQLEQLTNDEIIKLVVSEIKSSRATNADLEEEHVALAPWAEKEIRALWRDEKEWRAKEAKPKPPRRIAVSYHVVGSVAKKAETSFILPTTQPAADETEKDTAKSEPAKEEPTQEKPDGVAKFIQEIKASSRALAIVKPFETLGAEDLQKYLDAMNVRHAVIGNVGGKCRITEWLPSELDEGAFQLSLQSKTDLIARYAHLQVGWTNRGQPLTLGQRWFEHPQRANHRGIVFKPGMPAVITHPDTGSWMNLWRGWGIFPEKGKWPLLRGHVEVILSGGEPKMADYIIRWTAWGFQNPGDLPEAALVLRGDKGSGKGIYLGTTIRRIYGPHGLQITQASHLTGRFNAHLWSCVYLFADEAFWAGDKQGEGVLKGLLTERPLPVEKKGVDVIMAVNHVKVGMSSNSYWVVPASHDERRYAVSDVNNRYAKGKAEEAERKEYFGAIQREIAEGGAAAMLYDLMQMKLGDWHPREVPVTKGLMRQKKESLRGNFQWLEPLLQPGELPANFGRPNRITTDNLLAYVKTFRGLEYATEESIASFLYDDMGFIPELAPEGNRFRGKRGGPRGWEFPPLLDLRARWETLFGGQWNWHDTEIDEWQAPNSWE
jgi:Family of unknown function (DUF5906)